MYDLHNNLWGAFRLAGAVLSADRQAESRFLQYVFPLSLILPFIRKHISQPFITQQYT